MSLEYEYDDHWLLENFPAKLPYDMMIPYSLQGQTMMLLTILELVGVVWLPSFNTEYITFFSYWKMYNSSVLIIESYSDTP